MVSGFVEEVDLLVVVLADMVVTSVVVVSLVVVV